MIQITAIELKIKDHLVGLLMLSNILFWGDYSLIG